ncbi:MAG: hypothetical protein WBA29_15815 [Xanthobacteraceae bacterium]
MQDLATATGVQRGSLYNAYASSSPSTRGLAVMERAGYSRRQLKRIAATFAGAMAGDA